IFIDTNIFLDFYRIRRTDISLKYLDEIVKHKDIIITSSQIEMEYKKNRQVAILESITEVTKKSNINLSVPAILTDAQALKMLKKAKEEVENQQQKLKVQIERILKNPNQFDPVYKSLQKIFTNKSAINLNRDNKIRFSIRNLAKKRFVLGYPPRKNDDNSIGDSINWEWIIKCAEITGKHIIIVTRDTDFGAISENESYLNDWLKQEFKQRISQKRKIILTNKLSMAFKLVEIPVSKEMIEEEKSIIKDSFASSQKRLQEAIFRLSENLSLSEYIKNINSNSLDENK
uniref:PIN domain-containing protein n=1 Tax=Flavobacterium sp. TaxID=239 RepID=UPI0037C189A2